MESVVHDHYTLWWKQLPYPNDCYCHIFFLSEGFGLFFNSWQPYSQPAYRVMWNTTAVKQTPVICIQILTLTSPSESCNIWVMTILPHQKVCAVNVISVCNCFARHSKYTDAYVELPGKPSKHIQSVLNLMWTWFSLTIMFVYWFGSYPCSLITFFMESIYPTNVQGIFKCAIPISLLYCMLNLVEHMSRKTSSSSSSVRFHMEA